MARAVNSQSPCVTQNCHMNQYCQIWNIAEDFKQNYQTSVDATFCTNDHFRHNRVKYFNLISAQNYTVLSAKFPSFLTNEKCLNYLRSTSNTQSAIYCVLIVWPVTSLTYVALCLQWDNKFCLSNLIVRLRIPDQDLNNKTTIREWKQFPALPTLPSTLYHG